MSVLHALASYARVRLFPHRFRDRAALERWQSKRLRKWLQRDVPKVDAFSGLNTRQIDDLPLMDKAALMADFSRYTTARITNAQGWQAFEGSRRLGALTIGASTGTSGNRGLFAISEAERFAWLGAILAKTNPAFWRHRDRVAVVLPIDTPLYHSANKMRGMSLSFFDLNTRFETMLTALEAFAPTLIVAPPRILRRFAETRAKLRPRRVFSAAEKLEMIDRTIIEEYFNQPLHEIYMATEGLFATTCAHGRLHLAEDCMHFAFEPVGDGLVMPVISDFSRTCQIMARYRMNDLLRLDPSPCPCGSPLMGVAEIVGREDDIFWLPGRDKKWIELTPDILRNTILDSDRAIQDFRLVQQGPKSLRLELSGVPDPKRPVTALNALLSRHGCAPDIQIAIGEIADQNPGKLRRIRQEWKTGKRDADGLFQEA